MKAVLYCELSEKGADGDALQRLAGAGVELILAPVGGLGRTWRNRGQDAVVYLDAAAFTLEKLRQAGERMGRIIPWGVLDRGGALEDPAVFFRLGAADYLGPPLAQKSFCLSKDRLEEVRAFLRDAGDCGDGSGANAAGGVLIPTYPPFPGWKSLRVERCYPFVFVFAALADQKALRARLGEQGLDGLRRLFTGHVESWAERRGGVLWIRDAGASLLLFPAAESLPSLVRDLVSFQLNRTLVAYEQLRTDIPVRFRFAVHEGDAPWRSPGTTGTVVSEHVNFIYHLGYKSTPDGIIGISEAAVYRIPPGLLDLFPTETVFEDRRVRYSVPFD